jgi:hypothetical protein
MPPKKRGPKPGAKVKAVTKRDTWNANKKSRGTGDGVWKTVGGVRRFFPKP